MGSLTDEDRLRPPEIVVADRENRQWGASSKTWGGSRSTLGELRPRPDTLPRDRTGASDLPGASVIEVAAPTRERDAGGAPNASIGRETRRPASISSPQE